MLVGNVSTISILVEGNDKNVKQQNSPHFRFRWSRLLDARCTSFPPGLGGETVDDSKEVGGFVRGAADDGAAVAEDGGLVVVGLGACSGVEVESACVVSGEKH